MTEQLHNILLVDDDDIYNMIMKKAFQKLCIKNPLFTANDGVEALEMLRDGTVSPLPKIILLDLNMPRMNGIEFLKQLRSDPLLHAISVFVITTSNQNDDISEAYKLNIAGYIVKPVAFENFTDAIRTLNSYWHLCKFTQN